MSEKRRSTFRFVLQTTAEHSPTLEFEEFQTNPITYDVQDATTAETEREVQSIVSALWIRSESFPRAYSSSRANVVRRSSRQTPLYVPRTCAYLRQHMQSICTAQARVYRANMVYRMSHGWIPCWIQCRLSLREDRMRVFDRTSVTSALNSNNFSSRNNFVNTPRVA